MLHFRGVASALRYRYRAEITVWAEALSDKVRVPAQEVSGIEWT